MAEIEDQLRAWADVAAPEGAGEPVTADEVAPLAAARSARSGAGRRWGWAVAAVLVLAAGVAAIVVRTDDGGEPLRADRPPAPTTTSTPASDVDFELLHLGSAVPPPGATDDWDPGEPFLRAARDQAQLDDLWTSVRYLDPTRSSIPAEPEVDLSASVVVSIAIPDDNCAPELRGFRRIEREGRPPALVPRFVETVDVCTQPLAPKQYVVAIDWASAGDRFSVQVAADDLDGDGRQLDGDPAGPPDAEIALDRDRRAAILIDVELDATTVAAGSSVPGRVVVSNNSGAPVDATICGPPYAVGLRGPAYEQEIVHPLCASAFALPPETSSYEVTVTTARTTCTTNPSQVLGIAECLPDGSPPPMPAGDYRAFVVGPAAAEAAVEPVVVTVTDP